MSFTKEEREMKVGKIGSTCAIATCIIIISFHFFCSAIMFFSDFFWSLLQLAIISFS